MTSIMKEVRGRLASAQSFVPAGRHGHAPSLTLHEFETLLDLAEANQSAIDKARAEGREEMADELKALTRAYVSTLESGRDRILFLGGKCDAVDVMEASDPALVRARAAIRAIPAKGEE